MKLSAIVIALNEQENIDECLACLRWADEILVIDGGSQDATIEKAKQAGARVVSKPFIDFADQRNFAINAASNPWVLFVDADERISNALAAEIQTVIRQEDQAVYRIPRVNFFFGRQMRYSGTQNDFQTRLFPKIGVKWDQPVHEMLVTDLPRKELKNVMLHYSTRDIAHYQQKVACYVPLEVETMKLKGRKAFLPDIVLRPAAKFIYLYLVRFGFLDGLTGLRFAALSSYYDFKKYSLFQRLARTGSAV